MLDGGQAGRRNAKSLEPANEGGVRKPEGRAGGGQEGVQEGKSAQRARTRVLAGAGGRLLSARGVRERAGRGRPKGRADAEARVNGGEPAHA